MDSRLIWFESLYDTYADAIWRYLYTQLGDRERAKELMQDVFLKTWQYVMSGKTVEHEKAFLYRTARNLFINEIRTDKRTISIEAEELEEQLADTHSPDTASVSENRELHSHLDQLKGPYREVLTLRFFNELQVKEIAALLGEEENTISMRIKRGLEALKATYTNTV